MKKEFNARWIPQMPVIKRTKDGMEVTLILLDARKEPLDPNANIGINQKFNMAEWRDTTFVVETITRLNSGLYSKALSIIEAEKTPVLILSNGGEA